MNSSAAGAPEGGFCVVEIKMAGTWEKVPALSLAVESGKSLEEDETAIIYRIRQDLSRGE